MFFQAFLQLGLLNLKRGALEDSRNYLLKYKELEPGDDASINQHVCSLNRCRVDAADDRSFRI